MIKHSMTQMSNKHDILNVNIKTLNDLDGLLLHIILEGDLDDDTMDAIQNICEEMEECAQRIKDGCSSISNYVFGAGQELKKQDDVKETKTLKSTLDSWDATKVANAAAEAGNIMPVVDNVEDIDPFTASVGEVKENG